MYLTGNILFCSYNTDCNNLSYVFVKVFDLCTGGELFEEINRLAYFTEYDAVRLVKYVFFPVRAALYDHKST